LVVLPLLAGFGSFFGGIHLFDAVFLVSLSQGFSPSDVRLSDFNGQLEPLKQFVKALVVVGYIFILIS
jgi:hypothetical protein